MTSVLALDRLLVHHKGMQAGCEGRPAKSIASPTRGWFLGGTRRAIYDRAKVNTGVPLSGQTIRKMGGKRMNVAAILKEKGRSVTTVRTEAKLQDVIEKLAKRRIGAVVVVGAQGRVEGILSERDIVKAVAQRGAEALALPAADIMTRNISTCRESDTLDELMSTMTAGRFRHVPVIEDEALVGIVSIGDVVKHHIAEVELEASALKTYLVAG
jgi:CBS domain-containing protein